RRVRGDPGLRPRAGADVGRPGQDRRRLPVRGRKAGQASRACEGHCVKNKIVSTAEAVAIIRDHDTVAFSGFVGSGTPEELIAGLERRFVASGPPRALPLLFAAPPGAGKDRGLNRLAHPGLVKRAVGGHWSLVPKLCKM